MSGFYNVLVKFPKEKYFTVAKFYYLEDAEFYIKNELNFSNPECEEHVFKIMHKGRNIKIYD